MVFSSTFFSQLLYILPAVLIAIVLHEWAHGYISYLLGDPLPKQEGRLSLNPLKHLDPVGTLCLVLFRFGWAKPVMVNPRYYKNPKLGMVLTALAGPAMNFIIAFISLFIAMFLLEINPYALSSHVFNYLFTVLMFTASVSVSLGLFNLIPIPPLDGSKILFAILPKNLYFKYMQYERYGMYLLVVLLMIGVFDTFLYDISSSLLESLEILVIRILM